MVDDYMVHDDEPNWVFAHGNIGKYRLSCRKTPMFGLTDTVGAEIRMTWARKSCRATGNNMVEELRALLASNHRRCRQTDKSAFVFLVPDALEANGQRYLVAFNYASNSLFLLSRWEPSDFAVAAHTIPQRLGTFLALTGG